MLDYLQHSKSLVSKGKKKAVPPSISSSSPSVPLEVTTTASVGSPSLHSVSSDDKGLCALLRFFFFFFITIR